MNETHHPGRVVAPLAALAAGLLRLFPFAGWNVAPVGALALYSGARLPWWAALTLPLGVMYATDSILWRVAGSRPLDPYVYGTYALIALVGIALRHTRSPWKIGAGAVLSSVLFFAITNFGSWRDLYPQTWEGFTSCYIAAWPFARGTILGDLLFTPLFFGAHALLERRATVLEPAASPAVR
jgi:hypothetical protein